MRKSKIEREFGALEKELAALPPPPVSLPDIAALAQLSSWLGSALVVAVHVICLFVLLFLSPLGNAGLWVPFLPFAPAPSGSLWTILCALATLPAAMHGEVVVRPLLQALLLRLGGGPPPAARVLLGESLRRSRTHDTKED